ncbi:MAG: WhiB family transcriptional regulator, partial [Mycobacterium leprae]
ALDNRVEFGVWGGMTGRERRALLRRRANVSSWRRLLGAAQAEWEKSGQAEWEKSSQAEWAKSGTAERPLRAAG